MVKSIARELPASDFDFRLCKGTCTTQWMTHALGQNPCSRILQITLAHVKHNWWEHIWSTQANNLVWPSAAVNVQLLESFSNLRGTHQHERSHHLTGPSDTEYVGARSKQNKLRGEGVSKHICFLSRIADPSKSDLQRSRGQTRHGLVHHLIKCSQSLLAASLFSKKFVAHALHMFQELLRENSGAQNAFRRRPFRAGC